MANQPAQDPNKKDSSMKDKLNETVENFKKNENVEKLYSYAQSNTRDTIAYILMIIGIVLFIFHPFYGGLLVGLIAGLYFSQEIMSFTKHANQLIEEQGMVRSLMAGGVLIALFIAAPAVFIGAAIAVAIKQLLLPESPKLP